MKLEILFVGLQEQGASIALALAEANVDAARLGFDPDKEAARAAVDSGAIAERVSNPYKAARSADVILVTLPAAEADEFREDVADNLKEGALLIDCSPLKASSLRWASEHMERSHYIGAVPVVQHSAMFDLDTSYRQARPDLYQNSLMGLVVPAETPERAINIAVNIAEAVGGKPFFIDASEMEAVTSLIDTLPAALSLALLQTAADSRGWPDIQRIAGREFMAGTYSLAGVEGETLAKKLIENRQSLAVHLDQIIDRLTQLRQTIEESEQENLTDWIRRAVKERESWLAKREQADWEAVERGRSHVSSTGMLGNLFGFDPNRRGKRE